MKRKENEENSATHVAVNSQIASKRAGFVLWPPHFIAAILSQSIEQLVSNTQCKQQPMDIFKVLHF
jgi:hypothetical protein